MVGPGGVQTPVGQVGSGREVLNLLGLGRVRSGQKLLKPHASGQVESEYS